MFGMLKNINVGTVNVLFMSVCFFVLFAGDYPILNMQKTIVSSIHDDNPDFTVNGYNLLTILYISFGVSICLCPSAISILGLRTSMALASLLYTNYIFSLRTESSWYLYIADTVGGIGAALIWTGEGKYLVLNSTPESLDRNIGIFYSLLTLSSFPGNLYVYFNLQGKKYIDPETRHFLVSSLTAFAAVATILFALLRPPIKSSSTENDQQKTKTNALSELKKTWSIFATKEMLILSLTFFYTGLQQAFSSGVYGPSVGFTLKFGVIAKQLVPLSGFCVGIGQVLAGIWQIFQGKLLKSVHWQRRGVVFVGVTCEIITFALIFINIPASAVFGNTEEEPLIQNPSALIALVCSILLGLGDGCLNTQNFSIISVLFPDGSAQTYALYKLMKAFFVAIGYNMGTYMNLHNQVIFLSIFAIISIIAYFYVDILTEKRENFHKNEEKQ